MSTAALILAAGSSSRLRRPKQDVLLEGVTLLERAVRTAQQAGLQPVLAVVQEERWVKLLEALGATALLNTQAHQGMSSSVHLGITWLQTRADVGGVALMTCDQPALRAEHLRALCAEPARVTGSAYAGRIGVPAYFPAESFDSLLKLKGDVGARSLLLNAAAIPDDTLALDIDTEDDLRRAQQIFNMDLR